MNLRALHLVLAALAPMGLLPAGASGAPQEPATRARARPRPAPGPSSRPAAPAAKARGLTLAFTGDVSMTWRALPKNLKRLRWKQNPLRFFAAELRAADLSVANFEGVLAPGDPRYAETRLNLWAPVASGQVFARAGVYLVSNANNHAFDGRDLGVLRTMATIRRSGAKIFGVGRTKAEARRPYVLRKGSACVAIIPGTTKSNKGVRGRARVAFYPWKDWPELLGVVRHTARKVCPFVVVYLHWGTEKAHYPRRKIRTLGRRIIEAGASILVGHHPHVLQGVEYHRGGVIVYSLGNFVFSNPNRSTRRTGLLLVRLEPPPSVRAGDTSSTAGTSAGRHTRLRLARLELIPAIIHRRDYTPRPATRLQAEDLLRRVRAYCKPFGTQVVLRGGRIRFLSARDTAPPRLAGEAR